MNNIDELISSYLVIVLDESPFDVRSIMCDMLDSLSSNDISNDRSSLSPRIPTSISESHDEHIYPTTYNLRNTNNTANNSKYHTNYKNDDYEHQDIKWNKLRHNENRIDEDSMKNQENPASGKRFSTYQIFAS